jgi:peptidoglycan/LPS O-acetylase OafA/YrhL
MNRHTSVYIDALRFIAAMVVFLGHISGRRFTAGLFYQFGPYMQDAVTVFFVLSGFVIGYVADNRDATAADYAVARASRVYSVAIPAIALTLMLDRVGTSIRPDLYGSWWGFHPEQTGLSVLASIFFVNQIWLFDKNVGSLLPYWSLSYEIWYYVIFGVMTFGPKKYRTGLCAVLLLFVGPRIASLFPVWLAGFLAYKIAARRPVSAAAGAAMFAGSILALVGEDIWRRTHGVPLIGGPLVRNPTIVGDYVVGLFIALNLVAVSSLNLPPASTATNRLIKIVRWCAGATFTIYLFHMPIAQFLTTLAPWPPSAWQTRVLMFVGVLLAMFALAELTERRKADWRRFFWRLTRLSPSLARKEG